MAIMSATKWANNSELIADCRRLGYLSDDALTLDATYGLGNWWKVYKPRRLVTMDKFTPAQIRANFLNPPFRRCTFDVIAYDPPYKLNGTPSAPDTAYGVDTVTRWQDRMVLISEGVLSLQKYLVPNGYLLVKCQDQVCSGQVRWQTDMVSTVAKQLGMKKIDRMELLTNPRPQPHDRQIHSRRNHSTLLVFQN